MLMLIDIEGRIWQLKVDVAGCESDVVHAGIQGSVISLGSRTVWDEQGTLEPGMLWMK